ncbi:MAG: hypothetical protein COB98_05705 [Flavobacteriaceae bacterium]|nr:MAG: hypothetical protein COB98_05705 [Flavobacteriaceae bacterium]
MLKNKSKIGILIFVFITAITNAQDIRKQWVDEIIKISTPVLTALSQDKLKEKMPVEQHSFEYGDRSSFTHLEAFGRLMAGLAPWLELGADTTEEGIIRKKQLELALKSIENAVAPKADDFMNFNRGSQPLVDAAFLAQAFLRAPNQLWKPLPKQVKKNVIKAFESTRVVRPYYNNWLLFSATIEAFFLKFTDKADLMRIDYALKKHMEWYVGDGHYSDGEKFHWDYYNSFVIHPMLLDITAVLAEKNKKRNTPLYQKIVKRAQRYSVVLERLISPEGTFPIIGRSSIYRLAAFQTLSQIVLLDTLPKEISYGQVRSALTAVMKRLFEFEGTYNQDNWLQLGVVGHQPKLAEPYITTGSLYLTSVGFLHLGLPANHPFWTCKSEPWTMVKMWNGNTSLQRDRAIN